MADRPCAQALRVFAEGADAPPAGATVLVACSGGPDSMALVEACRRLDRWRLVVATVDHGLQRASAGWAEQVRAHWSAAGLAVRVCPVTLAEGGDVEARARTARYAALAAVLDEVGAAVGLTAHTADDQAETLLMRLGAGAGLRGMAGVPPVRGPWRRPWLDVSRAEVRAFAQAAGLPLVLDPANADARFERARLRGLAAPGLTAALGPHWPTGAARTATLLREALDREAWLTEGWWAALQRPRSTGISLDVERLRAAPEGLRRWALARVLGDSTDRRVHLHVPALEAVALGAQARHGLPQGRVAWRAGGALIIDRPAPALTPVLVTPPGDWTAGGGRLVLSAKPTTPEAVAVWLGDEAWLRGPRAGDVWAGRAGHKPLGRALRDGGLGEPDRAACPVLVSGGAVRWAAGLGAACEAPAPVLEAEGLRRWWLHLITGPTP